MKFTKTVAVLVVMLVATLVFADEFRSPALFTSDVNFDTGSKVKVMGSADFLSGSTLKIQGTTVTASASEINAACDQSARVTTATVVDNGSVTLSAETPYVIITGTGQALNASCDIVFAQPFPASGEWTIMCAYGSTNYIRMSNVTAQVIGDTTTLRAGDAIKLFAQATNRLCLASDGVITSNRLAAADFGALTVAAGGSVSIDSDGLPATVTSSTTISNQNLFVYGSNITAKAGGTVTFAGTTVLSGLPTTTNGFSITGSAWNSNGYVCVWAAP